MSQTNTNNNNVPGNKNQNQISGRDGWAKEATVAEAMAVAVTIVETT